MDMYTLERVREVIARELLGCSYDEVTPEARIVEDLGANEVDLAGIWISLIEEFDVDLPDDFLENLKTPAEIAAELEKIMN